MPVLSWIEEGPDDTTQRDGDRRCADRGGCPMSLHKERGSLVEFFLTRPGLNGWKRLWALLSVASLLPVAIIGYLWWPVDWAAQAAKYGGVLDGPLGRSITAIRTEFVVQLLTAWALSCGAVYALGWGIAWVRRGFANSDPS